jgi:hypothetical protein
MNFFHFDLFNHVPTLIIAIINCSIFGFFFYWIYKTYDMKPKKWKAFLFMFFGMFTFSINLNFFESHIQLPILPLGVWILMLLAKRKNENNRWEKYRKFAWTGFLLSFVYLIMSLFIKPIDHLIYPKDKLQTYISNLKEPQIISTDPTISKANLLNSKLLSSLNTFHVDKIWNEKWYYETYARDPKVKSVERFPYVLLGTKTKFGSNLDLMIYIEKDGKGILITTRENQYYFRSDTKIISPAKGGNNDVKK